VNDNIKDFLSFRKMVTMSILKYVYMIGVVSVFVAGIVSWFMAILDKSVGEGMVALFISLVVQIVWRLACEGVIILFSMHDILSSIERQKR